MLEKPKSWGFWLLFSFTIIAFLARNALGSTFSRQGVKKDTESVGKNKADVTHLFKPYNLVRHNFENEYDRSNPITAEEKTKEYLKWIFGKILTEF
jgi:hypothetical protein